MKAWITALGLTGIVGMICTAIASGNPGAETAATTAAQTWLAQVDQGQYGASWDQAATYFKQSISRDNWISALQGVRTPLGQMVSRSLKSRQYRTSLPGAPDGQYVVIQYNTSFTNKKTAVETVTPMLDKDGQWRVSGYYIK